VYKEELALELSPFELSRPFQLIFINSGSGPFCPNVFRSQIFWAVRWRSAIPRSLENTIIQQSKTC